MATIIFKGWKVGMRRIPTSRLLQEKLGLSLKQAWDIGIRIVENETIALVVDDLDIAQETVAKATELGVICEVHS